MGFTQKDFYLCICFRFARFLANLIFTIELSGNISVSFVTLSLYMSLKYDYFTNISNQLKETSGSSVWMRVAVGGERQ